MRPTAWKVALVISAILLCALGAYAWLSAPTDPVYNGVRFSSYVTDRFTPSGLKRLYSDRVTEEAFRSKGVEAAPLLASWLETEHPPFWLRLQDLLRKWKVASQLLPQDRQQMAFDALDAVPVEGALRALQIYLASGNGPTIRLKAASTFMRRFNTAPEELKRAIAAESGWFIQDLLAYFEKNDSDEYPLTLIAVLIKTKAVPKVDQFEARIRKGAERSRYLRIAVSALDQ